MGICTCEEDPGDMAIKDIVTKPKIKSLDEAHTEYELKEIRKDYRKMTINLRLLIFRNRLQTPKEVDKFASLVNIAIPASLRSP